ncbi:hypothetical protein OU640_23415, partial [Escherichia coli]|nr:hypothetical protein [Escherichia coli]
MAEQTSRLAIIIDSTGAKNNADNLTSSLVKMTQAGETAANSAGKVTKATEDEKNALAKLKAAGNDSNLLIVFYVQIMPDDFVMQLHR